MTRSALPALGAVVLVASCSPLEPEPDRWERVVGTVEIGGQYPSPVQLPEEAVAGVPFTATIVTYGSGTCTRADGAEVDVIGLRAEVTPYDLEYRGPGTRGGYPFVCTDDLAAYPRDISLLFSEPGNAEIAVIGRTLEDGTFVELRFGVRIHPR